MGRRVFWKGKRMSIATRYRNAFSRLTAERDALRKQVAELEVYKQKGNMVIDRLKSELRECAMATGLTTGNEEKDSDSLVEPVTCLPLETADLVNDRVSGRDIRIAELERENADLRELARRVVVDFDKSYTKDGITRSINAIDAALKDHRE